MRLEHLCIGMVRDAVSIYMDHAYAGAGPEVSLPFEGPDGESIREHLDRFIVESPDRLGVGHRYIIRLGNARYPFMKFVLQEHLIEDEYFLAVDTHDEVFDPRASERDEVLELRRFNLALKGSIETAWHAHGLPTCAHLRGVAEALLVERAPAKGIRILLVDDEEAIADTLELLLRARGFDVDRAADGLEALEKADADRHQLVLMDNEMPHLHGLKVCELLKASEETRKIPVLLATAGQIDMEQVRRADGFLAKPFQGEILFSFIEHLLDGRKPPVR